MNEIRSAWESACAALRSARARHGAWQGELSSSALSTATAATAFALAARGEQLPEAVRARHAARAAAARAWIVAHQNEDGGWGDTVVSRTNISTTVLCWAALGMRAPGEDGGASVRRAEAWLARAAGSLEPAQLADAIRRRYDPDRTFSVPILLMCAITGRLGKDGWAFVPPLPFELAAFPHRWFRWLNLRTVSYALPALIAVGQARHHHRPTWNPLTRVARLLARKRTLRILGEIQPESGGYLEAAPLTSFVSMSLLSMRLGDHPVVHAGLRFLEETVRGDGSWPIDTNLDTWVTSLAVAALDGIPADDAAADGRTGEWLLDQQGTEEHPFTHADPGGWAWTDLSGGVPDADDTSGALRALRVLHGRADGETRRRIESAAWAGMRWLLDLQNGDGGIPTFCRGWGKLPFDRSCPDITAHALLAWDAWEMDAPEAVRARVGRATSRAIDYLLACQRPDGSWVPLWFGNEAAPDEENPMYGTTRVLRGLAITGGAVPRAAARRAAEWVLAARHGDGGFGAVPGCPPTIEETALAVEGLSAWWLGPGRGDPVHGDAVCAAVSDGARWLVERTLGGTEFQAAPIGLYFAKLWYFERLYPLVFTVSALGLAVRVLEAEAGDGGPAGP